MDVQAILTEIGHIIIILLGKGWELLQWLHRSLVPVVGEPGAFLFTGIIVFVPVLIFGVKFISDMYTGVGTLWTAFFSFMFKALAVLICVFVILFILRGG